MGFDLKQMVAQSYFGIGRKAKKGIARAKRRAAKTPRHSPITMNSHSKGNCFT